MIPLLLVFLSFSPVAFSEPMDANILKALEETQAVIRNPGERADVAAKSPAAQEAARRVDMLGGSAENSEAIFELAAQIMGDLAKQTGGDPDKMQQILDQAAKNPEAFGNRLTPQQKQKLHELSLRLPAGKSPAAP